MWRSLLSARAAEGARPVTGRLRVHPKNAHETPPRSVLVLEEPQGRDLHRSRSGPQVLRLPPLHAPPRGLLSSRERRGTLIMPGAGPLESGSIPDLRRGVSVHDRQVPLTYRKRGWTCNGTHNRCARWGTLSLDSPRAFRIASRPTTSEASLRLHFGLFLGGHLDSIRTHRW
jgi:hypothetical protein